MPFSFSLSALAIMMLYSLLAPYTCMSLLVLFSPLHCKRERQRCSPSHRLFHIVDAMHARLIPQLLALYISNLSCCCLPYLASSNSS